MVYDMTVRPVMGLRAKDRFYGSKVMETFVFKGVEYRDAWFEVLKKDFNVTKQNIYEALDVLRIDHERCMNTGEPEPFEELLMHAKDANGSSKAVVLFKNTGRNDNQFAFAQMAVLPIFVYYKLGLNDKSDKNRKACFFRESDAVNTMNALGVIEYTITNNDTGRGRHVKNFDIHSIEFECEKLLKSAKIELTMNGEMFVFDTTLFNGVQFLKCYYDAMSSDASENAIFEQDTMPNLYWAASETWKPIWVHADEMWDDEYQSENLNRIRKIMRQMLVCLRHDYESGIQDPVFAENAEFHAHFGAYVPGYDPETNDIEA